MSGELFQHCVVVFSPQLYEAVLLYDYCMDNVFTELVFIQLAFLLLSFIFFSEFFSVHGFVEPQINFSFRVLKSCGNIYEESKTFLFPMCDESFSFEENCVWLFVDI